MTFPTRPLLLLVVIAVAACSPVIQPSESPHSPSTGPTASLATLRPVAPTDEPLPSETVDTTSSANLGGEWFCYSYQAGVGTNAVNKSGIAGGNSLLGSFHIESATTYASFFGADEGTYRLDSATSGIVFDSGAMLGLSGTYGFGPEANLIDLHGTGNGWDAPSAVALICQHA